MSNIKFQHQWIGGVQYRGHPPDHDLDGGSVLLRIGIGERETTFLLLLVKPAERTAIKVTNG